MELMRKEKADKKRKEEDLDGMYNGTSSEEEKDLSGLTAKQRKQYNRHMGVIRTLKQ